MVVIILSPVFYWYFRKTKVYGLLLLGLCYLSGIWPQIHGFKITSFFYFGMGAYLAIYKRSIVEVAKKVKHTTFPIASICMIICIIYYPRESLIGSRTLPFYVLSGVWCAFYISSYLVEIKNFKPNAFLVQSCFFVYALHIAPLGIKDGNLLNLTYNVTTNCLNGIPHVELLQFLLPPFATILICLILFWILQRTCSPLCAILTGNRNR